MPDPFLIAHMVGPYWAELGGRLAPVSVRDQMVRGAKVIRHAARVGLIGPGRPLVVLGAGAAGVTAAMEAVRRGVQTVLVESRPTTFHLQRAASTRWLDPTAYDWPAVHWQRGSYPWQPVPTPLPWRADMASALAARWTATLGTFLAMLGSPSPFAVLLGYTARVPTPTPTDIVVPVGAPSGKTLLLRAGLLVSCTGFGKENTTAGTYTGAPFWSADSLLQPRCGQSAPVAVLSGGGDGALQDFLRAETGMKSARALIEHLMANVAGFTDAVAANAGDLQSAEDEARRAWQWNTLPTDDHETFGRLHARYLAAISDIWTRCGGSLATEVALLNTSRDVTATLVHPCHHFGNVYGLNRLLTLLVARSRPGSVVADEGLVGYVPATKMAAFAPRDCDGSKGGTTRTSSFDVVVVRHGVAAATTPAVWPRPSERHVLPFHPR